MKSMASCMSLTPFVTFSPHRWYPRGAELEMEISLLKWGGCRKNSRP